MLQHARIKRFPTLNNKWCHFFHNGRTKILLPLKALAPKFNDSTTKKNEAVDDLMAHKGQDGPADHKSCHRYQENLTMPTSYLLKYH